MTTEDRLKALDTQIAALQREQATQEATYQLTKENVEATVSAMKEHFGVSSVEDAKALLAKMEAELAANLQKIEELLDGKK